VWFDLGGIGVVAEPEAFHEALRERAPIHLRIGDDVGVVIADRAVDLAGNLHPGELFALTLQARHHVGDFLAQRAGRRGLAMRARQQRQRCVGVCQLAQLGSHGVELWQQHLVARIAQHQRVGQIVDVLAGAGEVHEFLGLGQTGVGADLFLDEILDRFHVVVGGRLDRLDPLAIGHAEVLRDGFQRLDLARAECRQLGDFRIGGQRQQPFDLDLHTAVHQAVLAEDRAQRLDLAGVAAVQW
jgi:hypothetical protein